MIEKIKSIIPQSVYLELDSITQKYSIDTPLRLAHFMSQTSHESGGFKHRVENLNYSEAGLRTVFPKYFPGDLAKEYEKNPTKIANRIYASRMGNGDEKSGDGYLHRGQGYLQITGSENQKAFFKSRGLDINTNPEDIGNKYPLESSAWFWSSNHINIISDLGSTKEVVTSVTKKINGGTIGLEDRIKQFDKFYTLLSI